MKLAAPRGTYDILPEETKRWQALEQKLREIAGLYGFGEIRFPIFEHTELFTRGMGETGDVVQKEMYTFLDKEGRSLTLRPEGTASTVRVFIEHGLHMSALPFKCFYIAPNFRYEKPQKGRYRQHVQFGCECFGAPGPQADAEIISLAYGVLNSFGNLGVSLRLNSIGCKECRPAYQTVLKAWLSERADGLCPTCRERLERNPMRVLDCKVEGCKTIVADAPVITEHLCETCADFSETLQTILAELGIPFELDPKIMRGFDYYTGTVFEFISNDIGSQGAVAAGGRYDGLVAALGGPPTPALGFGMGLERLLLVLTEKGLAPQDQAVTDLYLAPMGDAALRQCVKLCQELRHRGVRAETDLCRRSLKAQMKYADKLGAAHTAVIGGNELAAGLITIKNMRTGGEEQSKLDAAAVALTIGGTTV
ncbi:MAG: histidine--tRNA ligase [Oscillospiraceae bacterium]|jgi:histidyl-tRNA synthetase|nr:histidine--tRNA ligase [Oscillospiraceae bacterium]